MLGNFSSALQSHQGALDIRVKLFREEHLDTAKSYFYLRVTQHTLGNFSSALQSHQHALEKELSSSGKNTETQPKVTLISELHNTL